MKVDPRILSTIADYHSKYRHPDLDRPIVSDVYALFPDECDASIGSASRWPETYPNFDRPGVYLIFTAEGDLLYIGKAKHLSGRLGFHFQYEPAKRCRIVGQSWTRRPSYLMTVGLQNFFEAPSLEEYLIDVLQPSDNSQGVRRRHKPLK